jgi:hypothetical protein
VVGYIAAFSQAVDWLYDPANKEEAIGIFLKNQNNSTRQAAETSYGVLLSPKEGFQKKAQIDMEGVRTALLLRSKYGVPKKTLTDPTPYYDASFHTEAMKRAR